MSALLSNAPYAARDEDALLRELTELTAWHRAGCAEYARIVGPAREASSLVDLPLLHVSTFKHVLLVTEGPGIEHRRTLLSSSTTSGSPSRIALDETSSALQAKSATAILRDFVDARGCPLVVLDSAASLRHRTDVAARVAAAFGLRALASDMFFVLEDGSPAVRWDRVLSIAADHDALFVYGTSWLLWQAWATASPPPEVAARLARLRITFVHSGGWKRLERVAVSRVELEGRLLAGVAPGSRVVDFYGLVEQNGVVYPMCSGGVRHVPRWAHVIVRDPATLEPTSGEGMLQSMNPLARGAPYHNVLTEDLARLVPGPCACGRQAPAFTLLGRLARAELRGCSDAVSPRSMAGASAPAGATAAPEPAGVVVTTGGGHRLVVRTSLADVVAGFAALARKMARTMPPEFARDEWAYLLRFVGEENLRALVETSFGAATAGPRLIFRPRSPVAVWLPSTVSAVGPLMIVLASLGGARLVLKASTRGTDLTTAFLEFARAAVAGTPLGDWLAQNVEVLRVSHEDAAHAHLAARSSLRVVFGSDEAARSVDALPHPARSLGLHFATRSSEAWLDRKAAADAATAASLLSVFAVYGQAACTAPRRAVVLEGSPADARSLAETSAASWPAAPAVSASETLLAEQWGRAAGWTALTPKHRAGVVLLGTSDLSPIVAARALHVVAATREEALRSLPTDIQTIGVACDAGAIDDALVTALALRGVARVVPLARMHHFGGQWDGFELLRSMFEVTVVDA